MFAHERWSPLDVRLYLQNLRVEKSTGSERRNSGERKKDESRVWDEIRSSLSRDQLTVSKNGGHQCKYLLAAFKA